MMSSARITKAGNLAFVVLFVIVAVQRLSLLADHWLPAEPEWQRGQVAPAAAKLDVERRPPARNETIQVKRQRVPTITSLRSPSNDTSRPKRSQFMVNGVPTNETRRLLDFVVAGFAKCGTTTLGTWLGGHPDIRIPPSERYDYTRGLDKFVKYLYSTLLLLPGDGNPRDPFSLTKGFRSPHFIQVGRTYGLLQQYFPDTKLIVSVRHPVLWFESYYNYRLEQKEFTILKGTPNELIGELDCQGCQQPFVLSTAKGRFHRYLARLHKTPLSSDDELKLLGAPHKRENPPLAEMTKVSNPVFFLETLQLADTNQTRARQFRHDLRTFLGLDTEFPDAAIPKVRPGRTAAKRETGTNHSNIDICDAEYRPVVEELLHISRNASIWFRTYFMESDEVFVSSREYLNTLLERWMLDPCEGRIGTSG